MRNLLLGILIGSCLTTAMVGAADYLGTGGSYLNQNETQAVLGEIRTREALETIQMQRQNYLDQHVREAGKAPCP
jgi:hypothetical protein